VTPLRIGIIGTGNMGQEHARRLAGVPGAALVAVADVNVEQAKRVAEAAGARALADSHELIGSDAVEAVLIASPSDTHEEFTQACIAAGKPMFCEKPLAPTADACLRVLAAETAQPRRLVQVGFMRRYDDDFRALKQTLDSGQLGRALLLHCRHRNPDSLPGFTSDMMITDSVVHDIDMTRWLLGQEVTAASVFQPRSSSLAPEGLLDPQLVLLETAEGVVVDVESFVNCQYGYDIRYELVGETGTASLGETAGVHVRQRGRHHGRVPASYQERFGSAYQRELRAWVAGACSGELTGPSAWDGYATTAVAEACVQALHEGCRATVALADRPAFYA